MAIPQNCFLTGLPATVKQPDNNQRTYVVESQACRTYKISRTAATEIPSKYSDSLHILAAIARRRSEEGNPISLRTGNVEDILDSEVVPETPFEKIDQILRYLYKNSDYAGDAIPINYSKDYPVAFSKNEQEFKWLIERGVESNYFKAITLRGGVYWYILQPLGWQRIDELRRTGRDSNQAFVAMWFDAQMDDAWKKGIEPALEEDTGWKALHMGALEHNEKIDDRMIAEIRRSGLLVADLTGHRQNVYFEAGFAMGLGIPVIYTCRQDDATDEKVHFDIQQYKHIPWTTPADLRQKLRERIEATGLAKTLRDNVNEK